VTHNIRTVRAVPLALAPGPRSRSQPAVPDVLEVRGEVYMPLKEFERINDEREGAGLTCS